MQTKEAKAGREREGGREGGLGEGEEVRVSKTRAAREGGKTEATVWTQPALLREGGGVTREEAEEEEEEEGGREGGEEAHSSLKAWVRLSISAGVTLCLRMWVCGRGGMWVGVGACICVYVGAWR